MVMKSVTSRFSFVSGSLPRYRFLAIPNLSCWSESHRIDFWTEHTRVFVQSVRSSFYFNFSYVRNTFLLAPRQAIIQLLQRVRLLGIPTNTRTKKLSLPPWYRIPDRTWGRRKKNLWDWWRWWTFTNRRLTGGEWACRGSLNRVYP